MRGIVAFLIGAALVLGDVTVAEIIVRVLELDTILLVHLFAVLSAGMLPSIVARWRIPGYEVLAIPATGLAGFGSGIFLDRAFGVILHGQTAFIWACSTFAIFCAVLILMRGLRPVPAALLSLFGGLIICILYLTLLMVFSFANQLWGMYATHVTWILFGGMVGVLSSSKRLAPMT